MKLFLPAIPGRYAVGVTTFVTPVQTPRDIGTAKIKVKGQEPKPALRLEEVAYTAYYPADVSSDVAKAKKGVDWFIRPIKESLQGFSTFLGFPSWLLWPVVYLFGSLVKIPAYPNVPLLHPRNIETKPGERPATKWPLVIFSHGLGGSRTAYSQICSRIAASGRVVLAVEHRDGTGTVSMPRSWHVDGNKSKPRTQLYLREADIHWEDTDSMEQKPFALRAEQLAFRHHEMYITYNSFCRLLHKDPSLKLETRDGSTFDSDSWGLDNDTSEALVNCDTNVVLAGHSFGGCTVLSILSSNPPEEYKPIPIERTLILDPWLEPLPAPGPIPIGSSKSTLNGSAQASVDDAVSSVTETLQEESAVSSVSDETAVESHPRMLVINSEYFTLWKPHFARLEEVVRRWESDGNGILTIVRSQHTSFSDFPILPLISKSGAHKIFDNIANLSLAFLDNRLEEGLKNTTVIPMTVQVTNVRKPDGSFRRKIVGNVGDVVIGGMPKED